MDWIGARRMNQIIRRRFEILKYDQELQKHILNDSAETGTSNILDAIRDDLTTDNDQAKIIGGL